MNIRTSRWTVRPDAFAALMLIGLASLLAPRTGSCGPSLASGLASAMATQFAIATLQAPKRMNFCTSYADSSRDCQSTYTTALRTNGTHGSGINGSDVNASAVSSYANSANGSADTEVVVVGQGERAPQYGGLKNAQPLKFQKRAPWVRRLETLGKEGIPFVRVPRGPDRELTVGITRKGRLGFELKAKR